MATLKKSKTTKASVIEASKKLFYEKGYVDTHYNDIVKESGINAGSVYYHFKKKIIIAEIILSGLYTSSKDAVSETFPDLDLQTRTAIETLTGWDLIFSDKKYRRFLYEIYKDRANMTMVRKVSEQFFDLHNEQYHLGLSKDYIKMISLTCLASEAELLINLEEGEIQFSKEEAANFDIRLIYDLLRTDYKKTEKIIQNARDHYSGYTTILEPYFNIRLIKKKGDPKTVTKPVYKETTTRE